MNDEMVGLCPADAVRLTGNPARLLNFNGQMMIAVSVEGTHYLWNPLTHDYQGFVCGQAYWGS